MLSKVVSRKSFLDLLQAASAPSQAELNASDRIHSLPHDTEEIQLIWAQENLDRRSRRQTTSSLLPGVILVGEGKKRDFLAWAWTYLPEFRPLTAYARVLDADEYRSFSRIQSSPSVGSFEEGCLGMIMGEAATYAESRQDKKLILTPLSCASTFSHAMARILALSGDGDLLESDEIVCTLWIKARNLTKQRQTRLKPEELTLPWRVLLQIYATEEGYRRSSRDVPEIVYDTCLSLTNQSELSPNTWNHLASYYPELREAQVEMQSTRERRVLFFEHFLLSLSGGRSPDPAFASFLCGFLASQIGPGTLDYLSLIIPLLDRFPSALLWYGLCSGLQKRSSLYGFSGGLGRRVLREILRNETLFDSPQGDLAIAELEVVAVNDTASTEFRTGAQGGLAIEILPLVNTTVRWPIKQAEQPELFPTETTFVDSREVRELRDLTIQLDDLRTRISKVQQRISKFVEDRDSSEPTRNKRQLK